MDSVKKRTFIAAVSLCVLAATILTAAAQPADIRQGLVAYWPLESHDGANTLDATSFANNLNLAGAPTVVAGQFGNAFTFDGTSTYLSNLHPADNYHLGGLPIYSAGSYTIAMWVKGPAQTNKYLFAEASTTNNNPLLILQTGNAAANSGKFDVIIRNDAGGVTGTLVNHVVSTTVVFDDTWHHIAWVDDRGSARLYVDGNLDPANFNYTPAGVFSFNTTAIGTLIRAAIATGNIFNGQMDDVAIWERAMSQAEVQQLMNNSLATPIPSLPPLILTTLPPMSVRALGESITLSVRAAGNRPLGYQWFKGDAEIAGATSTSLALTGLTYEDSGNYSVRVTNPAGTVGSTATLSVVFALPPEITQQPASQSVFTRSRVTFTAAVSGTAPLAMQWRKGGEDLPGATTPTLTLPSAALSDAGDYTLVVTNAAGSVTSQVATLTVTLRPPPPAELKIDINNTGQDTPAETEPGFSTFTLAAPGFGPFTKIYGSAEVTLSGVGLSLAVRRRATPLNSGAFTQEQLLRDFIFAADTNAGQGLDLTVEFLEPNAPYAVTIWSFDTANNNRVSDWSANGASVFPGYTFSGNVLPASNEQYQFKFDVPADADGKILIQGRRGTTASAPNNVFLNALKVARRELHIQKIEVLGFDLVLTIDALNPAATHRVEYKNSLADPDWIDDSLAFFLPPNGNILQVYVSLPDTATRYYRVVQVP